MLVRVYNDGSLKADIADNEGYEVFKTALVSHIEENKKLGYYIYELMEDSKAKDILEVFLAIECTFNNNPKQLLVEITEDKKVFNIESVTDRAIAAVGVLEILKKYGDIKCL